MSNYQDSQVPHLVWRAAIKKYDSARQLTDQQLDLLLEAANLAPTSYGLQPFKIWVVNDADTKAKLQQVGYNQPQFVDASHILVFAAKQTVTEHDVAEFTQRIMDQRHQDHSEVSDYEQMIIGTIKAKSDAELHAWSARQAYLALGVTIATAAEHKIDTSPMEGFDAAEFDTILGIAEQGYHAIVALAAGFRSPDDKYAQMPKVRKSLDELVHKI